jgi:hypothetical protein
MEEDFDDLDDQSVPQAPKKELYMEGSAESNFMKWATKNGIIVDPNVNLFATFEENGIRGVQTLKNINKNQAIVEVPPNAYISPAK